MPSLTRLLVRVVMKGERNTGKSSIIRMLLELPFNSEYTPTAQIQSHCLKDWSYKGATDDNVRLEIWDVVDKGKLGGAKSEELKFGVVGSGSVIAGQSAQQLHEQSLVADGEMIDVYRHSNAVIWVYDPSKAWTLDYVLAQLPDTPIPLRKCVLVVANFKDNYEEWAVQTSDALRKVKEILPAARVLESSCLNGYGRREILSWLNLPYLACQRAYLLDMVARNETESNIALEELDALSEGQSYESYMNWASTAATRVLSPIKVSGAPASKSSPSAALPSETRSAPADRGSPSRQQASPAPRPAPRPGSPSQIEEDLDDFLDAASEDDGWGAEVEDSSDDANNLVAADVMPVESPSRRQDEEEQEERQRQQQQQQQQQEMTERQRQQQEAERQQHEEEAERQRQEARVQQGLREAEAVQLAEKQRKAAAAEEEAEMQRLQQEEEERQKLAAFVPDAEEDVDDWFGDDDGALDDYPEAEAEAEAEQQEEPWAIAAPQEEEPHREASSSSAVQDILKKSEAALRLQEPAAVNPDVIAAALAFAQEQAEAQDKKKQKKMTPKKKKRRKKPTTKPTASAAASGGIGASDVISETPKSEEYKSF